MVDLFTVDKMRLKQVVRLSHKYLNANRCTHQRVIQTIFFRNQRLMRFTEIRGLLLGLGSLVLLFFFGLELLKRVVEVFDELEVALNVRLILESFVLVSLVSKVADDARCHDPVASPWHGTSCRQLVF